MIQFQDVSMVYPDGTWGLSDVSFRILPGEMVFVTGPSGAGKSTLLKLIIREYNCCSGHIYIKGKNISRTSRANIPQLRRSIGMVFQDFKLLPRRTVAENVGMALDVLGNKPENFKGLVDDALRFVSLRQKAGKYPHQLSGGEQQRVSIARALVRKPEIILADEPTGNLDFVSGWKVMDLFRSLNESGATIIVATHDDEIIKEFKSRVIALDGGRLISDVERDRKSCKSLKFSEGRLSGYAR